MNLEILIFSFISMPLTYAKMQKLHSYITLVSNLVWENSAGCFSAALPVCSSRCMSVCPSASLIFVWKLWLILTVSVSSSIDPSVIVKGVEPVMTKRCTLGRLRVRAQWHSDCDYTYTGVFQLMKTNVFTAWTQIQELQLFTRECVKKVSEPVNGA